MYADQQKLMANIITGISVLIVAAASCGAAQRCKVAMPKPGQKAVKTDIPKNRNNFARQTLL
jgi:hypothetical protein